jgi:phage repressor protein C with HTH and peptisase S24 domain
MPDGVAKMQPMGIDRGELRGWMSRVMAETGWSAAQWAEKANTSASNITRFLKDDGASMPKTVTLDKLESVVPQTLRRQDSAAPIIRPGERKLLKSQKREPEVDLQRPIVGPISEGKPDFAIYASAEGGNGEMIISFDPIEYVNRPLFLENVPGAYGFYCVGVSMSPRYEQGDMLLVRPGRPVSPGDDVLVILVSETNEHSALVKRFERWKGDTLHLRQLNPKRTVTLPRAKVHSVNLIVGRYNRSR